MTTGRINQVTVVWGCVSRSREAPPQRPRARAGRLERRPNALGAIVFISITWRNSYRFFWKKNRKSEQAARRNEARAA